MEEEQKQPKPRGGKRAGAGRKPKDGVGTKYVGARINKVHYQIIVDYYGNISDFISKAIKSQLKREGLI